MIGARRLAVLGGALLWLGVGVARFVHQMVTAPRAPAWAPILAPLEAAPLTPGEEVALREPIGQPAEAIEPLLMEAVWRRPDVRWEFLSTSLKTRPADALVVLGPALLLPGWHEVWRQGEVVLYRRDRR